MPDDMTREDKAAAVMQSADLKPMEFAPMSVGTNKPRISGPDLAAAWATKNISEQMFLACRLKWLIDWQAAGPLERYLWQEATLMSKKRNWPKITGVEYTRQLSGLVIAEVGDPKKWKPVESKCRWMWCNEKQWHRHHRDRYRVVFGLFDDWIERAVTVILDGR